MRHDSRNTGRSPIAARYDGDRPWAFRTGRGIFSTPVIGPDGTAYVGSADTYFYAVGAGGRLRWRLKTGGIIDAGGALAATGGATALTFGSADENLYHVTTPARPGQHPRILWRFRPTVAPVKGQQVNWWEGPVAIGPNGDIYAGNTGGTAYAVTPGGRLAWKFTAGGSLWTEPAFAPGGSSYWGSLDFNVYRVDAGGRPVWHTFTPGFVISSPAIGSDGTVYIASFDSKLYALDPQTGTPRWTFPTSGHVYASPALQRDAAGRTTGIYIASADGSVYALTPGGRLRWRYDTGDPIRSSPALGPAAGHGHGQGRRDIVYVGSSNGKLYGINADTGRRRWSYDTTPDDPVLRDRNDLNASPALGRTGVYIAGEHGYVDYVPYDYCLHRADARCSTSPAQELGNQLDRVFPVSPGGSTRATTHLTGVSPATVINLRLIVRRHGRTVNAAILDPRHVITTTPHFAFDIQESGDGHFLYVVPRGLLRPGMRARLRIAGAYTDNGAHMGNFDAHGPVAGHFRQTITLTTVGETKRLPLDTGTRRVTAITIRRLAVPMPAFLPSVNQIGFDSYDWIMSTIARTKTHVLVWVIGAVADARGVERVDPRSAFAFPMAGRYAGRSLALSSQNVSLQFSFGPAPLRRYEMRGSLTPQASFEPGAALYAETVCATVPNYGPELKFTGICNPGGLLAASGTFTSSPYAGSAASAPPGLHVATLRLTRPTAGAAGSVVARLAGHLLARRHHVAAVLLTNATSGLPLSLDYRSDTRAQVDGAGRITGVQLTLPRGTRLPAHIRAYVIADAFPLASRGL
jgi:outer membrane protein assembly factor BamB